MDGDGKVPPYPSSPEDECPHGLDKYVCPICNPDDLDYRCGRFG